jgi:DNA polymerase-3 subunit delta
VGPPELGTHGVELALRERGPHARARKCALGVAVERLGADIETETLAEAREGGKIAAAVAPEAKILPDDHALRSELGLEQPLGEFFGLDARELGVERLDDDDELGIDARDELDLALERRERGQHASTQHLGRVRVEREHDGAEPPLLRDLGALAEHALVSAVHAVEVTDDDERRPRSCPKVLRSVDAVLRHGAPSTTEPRIRPDRRLLDRTTAALEVRAPSRGRLCYGAFVTPDQAIAEAKAQTLRPVYLVIGEEAYLEADVLAALKSAALVGGVPGLNEDKFVAGEVDVEKVIAAARTLPMLAKRRLVVVRGLERWEPREGAEGKEGGKQSLERLAEYAKAPSPTTMLVLVGAGLDKRRRLVTMARSEGFLVSCESLARADLPRFVQEKVRARGCRIAPDVADAVAELTGPELAQVADAIERVCLYVGEGGEITEAAVSECVVRLRPSTVWELVGAVGRRDAGAALAALDQVYDPADRGIRLVGLLAWSTRQLVKFEAAVRAGLGPQEAAVRAGAPPFKARELAQQVRGQTATDLAHFLVRLAGVDEELKGGSKRPPKSSLERLILDLCGVPAPARSPRSRAHA